MSRWLGGGDPAQKTAIPAISKATVSALRSVAVARCLGGASVMSGQKRSGGPEGDAKPPTSTATAEYCEKLQQWIWQYYWGSASWQGWLALTALPPPCGFPSPGTGTQTPGAATSGGGQPGFDAGNWYSYPAALSAHAGQNSAATPTPGTDARPAQQLQNGNPVQAGTVCVKGVCFFLFFFALP